ncbi:DNA cytosine methyltransferase [Nitrospirillum iridis]|uniref:Site-specific DNA-cytosine methylase n=1 Tax=Nitrospirillum iridis TaxID=765888 RepID=A0A7X0AX85_9PROT|nr:DNA cytosine methyltransferase [Nitrospirillum iridis]MBB6251402.1 site-specific DNA-cytosine methylase [Nitrospirillum iridis]
MSMLLTPYDDEFFSFHIACGSGAGARGMAKARQRVGLARGRIVTLGGVDVDPACIRDFTRRTGVQGTVLDLFPREDYIAFHGRLPPPGWREATAEDLRRAAGYRRPHIVFITAPCKGASGLLSESKAATPKYKALNNLAENCLRLVIEAWGDDPPEFILFENVVRISVRGRSMLDRIMARLDQGGYASAETKHCCGRLGGLAQRRPRFLLVARNRAKVPAFLYEPPMRPLSTVGKVLEPLPPPGDLSMGLGHRVPALQWITWVRLAFVEAGKDWRSLNRLAVEDGMLRDFRIMPERPWRDGTLGVHGVNDSCGTITGSAGPCTGAFNVADPHVITSREGTGFLGVNPWDGQSGTISGDARPSKGAYAVADIRTRDGKAPFKNVYRVVEAGEASPTIGAGARPSGGGLCVADPHFQGKEYQQYGVRRWDGQTGTVSGQSLPGQGAHSVADPRCANWSPSAHVNKYKVVDADDSAPTVSCAVQVASGGLCVADPKACTSHGGGGKYAVVALDGAAGTVIGASTTGHGAYAVADVMPEFARGGRQHYTTGGHYGVNEWNGQTRAIPAYAKNNNGAWSVADPRDAQGEAPAGRLPDPKDRLVCVIRAMDGTWHRPFTTLELAALQGMVDPGEPFELDGASDSRWREAIGNAVPEPAAEAIGNVFLQLLMLVRAGKQQPIRHTPIWVRPVAIGAALDVPPLLI